MCPPVSLGPGIVRCSMRSYCLTPYRITNIKRTLQPRYKTHFVAVQHEILNPHPPSPRLPDAGKTVRSKTVRVLHSLHHSPPETTCTHSSAPRNKS